MRSRIANFELNWVGEWTHYRHRGCRRKIPGEEEGIACLQDATSLFSGRLIILSVLFTEILPILLFLINLCLSTVGYNICYCLAIVFSMSSTHLSGGLPMLLVPPLGRYSNDLVHLLFVLLSLNMTSLIWFVIFIQVFQWYSIFDCHSDHLLSTPIRTFFILEIFLRCFHFVKQYWCYVPQGVG